MRFRVKPGMTSQGGVVYLGNVRVVADEQGADRQVTHYYPFGSAFMDGKSPGLQPYKYNGKEQDKMHGLNLYDYHARHYDSAIDRFTTIDPLAEKYYSISPYAYVANNPMRFIDPDGKRIDDYTIDLDGYIRKVKVTKDKFDMLYAKQDYETGKTSNGLKLNKANSTDRTILTDLSENKRGFSGSYTISKDKNKSFKVFLFAANNSDVEWGIDGYRTSSGNEYFIRTSHQKDAVAMSTSLAGYNEYTQVFKIHSHPAIDGTKGASGFGHYYSGDMANIEHLRRRFQNVGMRDVNTWFQNNGQWTIFPKHYIYHKQSRVLYHYTPWENSIYIRKINKANNLYHNLGF